MTRLKPTIAPAALDVIQSAQYLCVSRSHFLDHIRKLLPVIDVRRPGGKKPMWRWLRSDLDQYLADRRKDIERRKEKEAA